jgi:hypothetical protein
MNTVVRQHGVLTALAEVVGQAVFAQIFGKFMGVQKRAVVHTAGQTVVATPVFFSKRKLALTIRAAWMRKMGFSQQEIDEACSDPNEPVELQEEIRNLQAAERLPLITPPSSTLKKWATWV